jgi:hypothetical protein
MKKNIKRMTLNRETLLRLAGAEPINRNYRDPYPTTNTDPVYTGPFYNGCPSYGDWCTFTCGAC